MKRKIYDKFLEWKREGAGKTALLINGARRVGKSYMAEAFARAEYKSYIMIDFNNTPDEVKELFYTYLNDLDNFFMYLSAFYNVKLYKHDSLIIFDEVQMFPRARAAIKYLVADGRFDYMETLISKSKVTSRHNISPIEVKSGSNYTISSLNKFRRKYREQTNTVYVIHKNDLRTEDEIVYLPAYMVPCL